MTEGRERKMSLTSTTAEGCTAKEKLWPWHIGLTILALGLMLAPVGSGYFFGSGGDWLSQHVGAAELLRQTMLETGTLFPQFTGAGGTSNIYDFAYYGLFRPDVLFSCLLPQVEMMWIIAGYALLGVIASVNLCFFWLRNQGIKAVFAAVGSVILAASTCMYHAHHQIIFINYLPFLILALIGIDRLLKQGRSLLLILSLFLIYLHSFFYSPVSLVVCLFYYLYRRRDMIGKGLKITDIKVCLAVIISLALGAVLLLPTAMDILSNAKDVGRFSDNTMTPIDLSLSGLLYQPYGCGLTLFSLYCLLQSLTQRKRRGLALALLICLLIPGIWLALNGFLYPRAKILIPFLPLLALICASTLQGLYQGKEKYWLLPGILCLVPMFFSHWSVIFIDGLILLLWLCLEKWCKLPSKLKLGLMALVLIAPICASLTVNSNEKFIEISDQSQNHYDWEELEDHASDPLYRLEILPDPLANVNILSGGIQRTSMYSSITNSLYSQFYYEEIANPISIQNRVALLPSSNPAFLYFMGVRWLVTEADKVPDGYQVVDKKGNYVLAENENVLPIAYGVTEVISQADYSLLAFPENVEALCSRGVAGNETTQPFSSSMKSISVSLPQFSQQRVELSPALSQEVLFLNFTANSPTGREAIVIINNMKNKLASVKAPYPNKNNDFHYILSSGEFMDTLEVSLSEGDYELGNIQSWTIKEESLYQKDVTVAQLSPSQSKDGKTVLHGSIAMEENGWFFTSYPYRDGYRVLVDEVEIDYEKVNTAFLGFPLQKGEHEIVITYAAPGFRAGLSLSFLGLLATVIIVLWERKKRNENTL